MIQSPAPEDPTILVIDDEEESFDLLRILFKRVGANETLEWIGDGEGAIAHLTQLAGEQRALPLMVVLDLKMPGMSGFEVLEAIKAHPALASLFVVVVSSSSLPEDIARAVQLGAFCYFEKYPEPDKFARVYEIARSRRPKPPGTDVADACALALRNIVHLVGDALAVCHLAGAADRECDRQLMNLLGAIRRRATEQLLARVNAAGHATARWPFEEPPRPALRSS